MKVPRQFFFYGELRNRVINLDQIRLIQWQADSSSDVLLTGGLDVHIPREDADRFIKALKRR